jgi:hypothetical protein
MAAAQNLPYETQVVLVRTSTARTCTRSVVLSAISTVALVCALPSCSSPDPALELALGKHRLVSAHRQKGSRSRQQQLQVSAMTAPWHENQQKVVVEFLKGNQGRLIVEHARQL